MSPPGPCSPPTRGQALQEGQMSLKIMSLCRRGATPIGINSRPASNHRKAFKLVEIKNFNKKTYFTAHTSISTKASFGRAETSTQERAGL